MSAILGRQEGVWIDNVAEDLITPALAEGIVLAAVSFHERRLHDERW